MLAATVPTRCASSLAALDPASHQQQQARHASCYCCFFNCAALTQACHMLHEQRAVYSMFKMKGSRASLSR
jgi:hypothetical protein